MGFDAIFALAVFVVVLAIIISEKIHRTVISLCGVCLILLVGVLSPEKALEHVDFNTIGLLVGMMIIVGVVKETGVFEYLAILAAKKVKGDSWKILLSLCVITAVISAFLDNVTTVLLIVPMTLVITKTLELDPIPFLIPEILASNIGGTATLIGDPPNIMIGSQVGLSFMDFIVNLGPIIVVIFIVTFAVLKILYRNKFNVSEEKKQAIMALDEKVCIKNHSLLKKSLFVLGLVLFGFFTHSIIHYEPSVIALTGAALLLLLSRASVEDALHSVEWPTIFFFAALFVLVGALREAGLIDMLADEVIALTDGNLLVTGVVLIWFSAIVSAFVDNIPFVATLIPMIQAMGASGMDVGSLWWAISLGACLGGNGTLIGASANVVVAGLAEKYGYPLSFGRFLKMGFPLMILSIVLSTIYLVIFYFI